jgi:23S rRNA (guanine2445-N2)-methyltransferase
MPFGAREVFFATCAPGLEPVLHDEVRALRLGSVERQVGGVHFEGTIRDAWRANLWLRTAVRVLQRVARFEAKDANALHAGASAVDWSRFLRADGTFVVDARSKESALDHTLFVEQRVKDAIADQFRERSGRRPSVDKEAPDLGVHAHLFRDRCTLMVDTSGESLHKRGWRRYQGRAPLAETLAAAIVLLSGWDRRAPLLDPFCGSGTILVEGALIAGGIAPGIFRERFGFELWPGHDAEAWRALRDSARAAGAVPPKLVVRGRDTSREAIAGARENVAAAGLDGRIVLEVGSALDFEAKPGWNATIVTNPPYGERVGEERDLEPLYRRFGERLRERCAGYRLALLSGNPKLARALALTPDRVIPLLNGALACELLLAEIPR